MAPNRYFNYQSKIFFESHLGSHSLILNKFGKSVDRFWHADKDQTNWPKKPHYTVISRWKCVLHDRLLLHWHSSFVVNKVAKSPQILYIFILQKISYLIGGVRLQNLVSIYKAEIWGYIRKYPSWIATVTSYTSAWLGLDTKIRIVLPNFKATINALG